MKGTGSALIVHMSGPSTTLTTLVKVVRKDGNVLAITDHDRDVPFGGDTYKSALGANLSNVDMTAALNVDNLEIKGYLASLGLTEQSVAAGLWDFAEITVRRVNWQDLSMGDDKIKRGWMGRITVGRDSFTNEVRGMTQKLQQSIGETYSPSCKANLFDERCKVSPTEGVWKFSGVAVTTIDDPQRAWTSTALTQADDFFTAGTVHWTTGANVGLVKEVKRHAAGGAVVLQEPMPYEIDPSDLFTIYAGCQKRWAEDCVGKFHNGINNRGFPFLPGEDATLRGL